MYEPIKKNGIAIKKQQQITKTNDYGKNNRMPLKNNYQYFQRLTDNQSGKRKYRYKNKQNRVCVFAVLVVLLWRTLKTRRGSL